MGANTLLTVEQLERLPEIEGISYELDQGELVEVPSASFFHNQIRDELTSLLRIHLKRHKEQGAVVAEQRFLLGPDIVRTPDVALVSAQQKAHIEREARTQPFGPALAAEIMSPSNTYGELVRETKQYLGAGARTVWILIPESRQAQVYTAEGHPKILCADDTLEEPGLLPGFSVRVADLFEV